MLLSTGITKREKAHGGMCYHGLILTSPSLQGVIIKAVYRAALAALLIPLALTGCSSSSQSEDNRDPQEMARNNPSRPFGTSTANLTITKEALQRGDEKSLQKAYTQVLYAAQKAREEPRLYRDGKKEADAYSPASEILTPDAWTAETKSLKAALPDPISAQGEKDAHASFEENGPADPTKLRAPILTSLAPPCSDKGTIPLRNNRGAGPRFYELDCKSSTTRVSPRASKIDADPRNKDGIVVTVKLIQTFNGYKANGDNTNTYQDVIEDARFYLVPDGEDKSHWLVDGAAYQYEYGRAKQEAKPEPTPERQKQMYCYYINNTPRCYYH